MASASRTVEDAPSQPSPHAIAAVFETQELHAALDAHAGLAQPLDQEALVLVLGKDDRVRERAEAHAAIAEDRTREPHPSEPEVHRDDADPTLDHRRGEAQRPVQLERPGLHGQRARGGARLRHLVDDANAHAQAREGERKHQPRGPRADDQDRARAFWRNRITSALGGPRGCSA